MDTYIIQWISLLQLLRFFHSSLASPLSHTAVPCSIHIQINTCLSSPSEGMRHTWFGNGQDANKPQYMPQILFQYLPDSHSHNAMNFIEMLMLSCDKFHVEKLFPKDRFTEITPTEQPKKTNIIIKVNAKWSRSNRNRW